MELGRSRPIRSHEDIAGMVQFIEETLFSRYEREFNVVILNWIRFEDESPSGSREDLPLDEENKTATIIRLVA